MSGSDWEGRLRREGALSGRVVTEDARLGHLGRGVDDELEIIETY